MKERPPERAANERPTHKAATNERASHEAATHEGASYEAAAAETAAVKDGTAAAMKTSAAVEATSAAVEAASASAAAAAASAKTAGIYGRRRKGQGCRQGSDQDDLVTHDAPPPVTLDADCRILFSGFDCRQLHSIRNSTSKTKFGIDNFIHHGMLTASNRAR
jgi:hypothetical protein